MNDAGKQHKRAWEYDAYNFWVKHMLHLQGHSQMPHE